MFKISAHGTYAVTTFTKVQVTQQVACLIYTGVSRLNFEWHKISNFILSRRD